MPQKSTNRVSGHITPSKLMWLQYFLFKISLAKLEEPGVGRACSDTVL